MTLTSELCERIVAVTAADLDDTARSAGRRLVLDGLSVAVAGAALEPAPRLLAEHFAAQGGRAQSSLLGQGASLPAPQAALVNAAAMHVLDFEPMWIPSTHALSPALSAALALAEAGAGGAEVMTATLKGIEMQMCVLMARGHVESRNLKFHPPGFVGPLGATVAAAHLLGLDAETLATALGIASSRCGGLFSNIGTMTKASHCGYAAFIGVEAALLAARGFTSNPAMFDAPTQGYVHSFMDGTCDSETLLSFGKPWKAVEPGFAVKLFPAKYTTHYAINAALALHPRLPSPEAVESISMVAAEVPSADRPLPATGLEGKFSVQYTAAAGLLDGRVDLATFTDARLMRPDMQDMLSRISLTMDRAISSKYTGGRYLEMTARLKDGTVLTERCDMPRGGWGTPAPDHEEHLAKVRNCLTTRLPDEVIDEIIMISERLDQAGGGEIARLVTLARGNARASQEGFGALHAAY